MGREMRGVHTNIEIHEYIRGQMGLADDALEKLTRDNFADYREVFDGFACTIDSLGPYEYRLTVKNKKNVLVADSYTNFVTVNKQKCEMKSVIIYFPINKTFYVPKELRDYLLTK